MEDKLSTTEENPIDKRERLRKESDRRDWRYHFAGMAMQALISSQHYQEWKLEHFKDPADMNKHIGQMARTYADALLAELEKSEAEK